jgi:hypothetical protein
MGIIISPSTSKKQVPFLQEVLQADAAHMIFGKYTLYSVYATTANGTMLALGFATLFGNQDKQSWTHFWKFIKKTHPIINQSNFTIITNQDKGSLAAMEDIVPLVGRFLCCFHCRQTLSRNAVVKKVTKHSQLFGCTISSAVASQLPHFQLPEKLQGKDAPHRPSLPLQHCRQNASLCHKVCSG